VFDNPGDASSWFARVALLSDGYRSTGSFSPAGIGDAVKCTQATASAQGTSWGCETLSAYVVSYSWVVENGTGNGGGLESGMAYDAMRHLRSVVGRSAASLPRPPGPSLAAGALFKELLSPFPAALVPAGLSSPSVVPESWGYQGRGLEEGKVIQVSFLGSGPDFTGVSMWIQVFDTPQDAQSYFGPGLGPVTGGIVETPTNEIPFPPSGFSSSQQVRCNTYTTPQRPPVGDSTCVAQWGDVVVWGNSWGNASPANPKPTAADTNMAITLVRSALLRVGLNLWS